MSEATTPRELPIVFSAPMVRAILDGRKTQTRRVLKVFPIASSSTGWFINLPRGRSIETDERAIPYLRYRVGDLLWVREGLVGVHDTTIDAAEAMPIAAYAADMAHAWTKERFRQPWKWKGARLSCRFMPKELARIWLRVMGVRIERVQAIGKDGRKARDVLAEGIEPSAIEALKKWFYPDDCPAIAFSQVWEAIHGKGAWYRNDWVGVYEFERTER